MYVVAGIRRSLRRAIDQWLRKADPERGVAVLVSGVAGSGKTTLLEDIVDASETEAVIIQITARPDESALPFGLISQLVDQLPDSPARARIDTEMEQTPAEAVDPECGSGRQEQDLTRLLRRITDEVLRMASDRPVMLIVDDVQYADPISERALVHLLRRITRSRVQLVMAEGARIDDRHLLHRNGMTRQPHATHIHLHPLTPDEIRSMASQLLDLNVDRETAGDYWRLSGGNPLLLRAIVEEQPVQGSTVGNDARYAEDHHPIRHATLRCLHAGEPELLEIARVVAVVGDLIRPYDVSTLLQMNAETAQMAMSLLEETGLLDGMSFRLDEARDAVVHDMAPKEKNRLRRQTAQLLFERGAPALVVAEQLRLANSADERWYRTILTAATEAATDAEDLGFAKQLLEFALRSTTDSVRRAEIITRLTSLEWRLNPQTAASRIPRLAAAEQAGDLHGQPVLELFETLLWRGDLDSALRLADRFDHTLDRDDPADAHGLRVTTALVSGLYPGLGRRLTAQLGASSDGDDVAPEALDSRLRAIHAMVRVLRHGPDSAAVGDAEHILQLGSRSFRQLTLAITTLIYSDQLASARAWTDRMLARTEDGSEQVWHAMLHALRAEIALRLGDLPAAEMHATRALNTLPPEAAGIGVGGPLSVLLTVAAERGTNAADLLAQPVPDAMFQTRIGLSYIYARALSFLACGQPHAALSDFTMCGKLAQQWDFDQPTYIPWRSGAAQAYAALGDLPRARSLLEEQLHRKAAQISRRVRYETQAQLARLNEDTGSRIAELHRSAQRLSLLGLALPTARCLADLAEAQRLGGNDREAKRTERRARELGMACGTTLSSPRLPVSLTEIVPPVPTPEPDPDTVRSGVESLTKAERRVYEHAAQGKPNRDIADALFVTTSTVEQHLTRIYRKLSIKRRADLPAFSGPELSEVRGGAMPRAAGDKDDEATISSERHA